MGSKAMDFDRARLAAPRLIWMGIQSQDLTSFPDSQQFQIPLTAPDVEKIGTLLQRPDITQNPHYRYELQRMLQTGHKVEIQCMCSADYANLNNYIDWKLAQLGL
ncbi:hypothetical protein BJ085DRAFT_28234 [Dimargaris cristalligena]|uniref:Topoisomerase 6 subunit A/Spo11 TOPRIM domain-containing protein n=1 Tax=Dimargaris cristalligena TaxID=215637 RepID=A0A4P9ZQA4_9FUNG|nr:hypothetical protein BJ085DRAFT_28234 [Dimargaris cristalligena]|eukprot:RKP35455.1 hypothetical protein BJ085DRAFT_28234 [Dimargaris cristalligena]